MNKILFLLLVAVGIACGQAKNTMPDSLRAHRTDININEIAIAALDDSVTTLRLITTAHADSIDSLRDAITSISSQSLTDGKFYIGSAGNLPVAKSLSGAITSTREGATTIASGYITDAMISSSTNISLSKIGGDSYTIDLSEWYALDGLTSNIQEQFDAINTGTNYILSSGTDTASTNLRLTGTVDMTAGKTLIAEKPATPVSNQLTYSTSQGESGLYVGNGTLFIPDEDAIDDKLEGNYSYNTPEIITNGDDTLNFTTDRNFVKSIMTVAADNNLLVKFANSGLGVVTIYVIGGWNPSGTISWSTSIVGETLKWTGGVEPPLDTSTSDQIFMINFTKVTSTLIIGQWNWAE